MFRNYLSLYDPFREMDNLFFPSSNDSNAFGTDITDEGDSYKLTADLPGFQKEDINIDIEDNTLTLAAERHSEHEDKDKKGKFIRCERSYGSYTRSFSLNGIDKDGIAAKYDNGVLTLTLPKISAEIPSSRRLEIE